MTSFAKFALVTMFNDLKEIYVNPASVAYFGQSKTTPDGRETVSLTLTTTTEGGKVERIRVVGSVDDVLIELQQ